MSRGEALRVLGPLAWRVVERGGGSLPESDLLAELSTIERVRGTQEHACAEAAAARLRQLGADTALLRHDDGRWAFAHLSIAEYLAAEQACRDPKRRADLLQRAFEPTWREVVRFAAALLLDVESRDEEARAFFGELLRRSRRPGRYDAKIPSLLADVLADCKNEPDDVAAAIAKRVVDVATRARLTPGEQVVALQAMLAVYRDDRPTVWESVGSEVEAWFFPTRSTSSFGAILPGESTNSGLSEPPRCRPNGRSFCAGSHSSIVALGADGSSGQTTRTRPWSRRGWQRTIAKLPPSKTDFAHWGSTRPPPTPGSPLTPRPHPKRRNNGTR
jgi:hypothetical protein